MRSDERKDHFGDEPRQQIPQRQAGRTYTHRTHPETQEHAQLLHADRLPPIQVGMHRLRHSRLTPQELTPQGDLGTFLQQLSPLLLIP